MDLDDPCGRVPRLLVQTVDVLRDECVQLPVAFEHGERAMARVGFGLPRRTIEAGLPCQLPHFRIGHVMVDVRQPFGLWILGPHSAWTPEIGDA